MSNRFFVLPQPPPFSNSDSGSDLDDNDDTSLPFPKPLDRSSFLAPDFDAAVFLSSLSNRFQTLEDLQTELRELSQTLNKELVDLVNDNYQDFLSLGSTLSGGEEKIEDIRVGLLSFQRDVKGLRDLVEQRREEVAELLKQKKAIRQETSIGRALLEVAERLDALEEKLNIARPKVSGPVTKAQVEDNGAEQQWSEEWIEETTINESDDEYDSDDTMGMTVRLKWRTEEFLILKHLVGRHSPQHPFMLSQEGRIRKMQEILLSDLDMEIRREPEVKTKQVMLQVRAAIAE
ncbi:hypothetical protein G647_03667 [Cladophialophora carrionii CBS 160.54]|uniref:Conserved oligomeric Golgi complex subunit 2 n=1 Tax=Cladophialophora carrionii CBS 160.54 TaxID=1279043 RepID=V9DD95_9EURO|nr:uncharacterized protein G647_03667 [Cladophialophora carrionii CBS 160.54]ETI24298.1 hypothetical protein G647_03667 [Cladophialophora carrionii CBS 160.54]